MSTWHSVNLGPFPERQMQICSTMQHDSCHDTNMSIIGGGFVSLGFSFLSWSSICIGTHGSPFLV